MLNSGGKLKWVRKLVVFQMLCLTTQHLSRGCGKVRESMDGTFINYVPQT